MGAPDLQHDGHPPAPSVTVCDFLAKNASRLECVVGAGSPAMGRLITKKRLQKLGMALVGFTDYVQDGRIYVFGNTEWRFFDQQFPFKRKEILYRLDPGNLSCIMVSRGLECPLDLVEFAETGGIPILRTSLDSSTAMYVFTEFLDTELSSRHRVHGVLMDVFGVGILMTGESGIGKSECALELVLKGHQLVADDMVEIRVLGGGKRLLGNAPRQVEDVLELRGIGIVNIRELIGISAIRRSKNIHFLVELQRWDPLAQYERLGISIRKRELMGVEIPYMVIPVAPGRNQATLVEIACRVFLMRAQGRHPMGPFKDFLETDGEPPGPAMGWGEEGESA